MQLWKNLWEKLSPYKYVLIIAVVGALFLLWPGSDGAKAVKEEEASALFSLEEQQKKLEQALSQCDGVGRVSVLLTLKSDMEVIYSVNERVTQSRELENGALVSYDLDTQTDTVLLTDGAGGQKALVVKRIYPAFQGALVICEGADSAKVRLSIVEAVSGLTRLGADEITIMKMKP